MKRVLYATQSVAMAIKCAQFEAIKEFGVGIEDLPEVRGVDSVEWLDSQQLRCRVVVWLEVKGLTVKYAVYLTKWSDDGSWHMVHIFQTKKGEISMNAKLTIDIEKFVWAYSNCPQAGNRDGSVIPEFFGNNGNFNDVTFILKPGARYVGNVEDHFGEWGMISTDQVERILYRSCTGSYIELEQQSDRTWVVTKTEKVGLTTYKRLRAAGYEGSVDRRPFLVVTCTQGHTYEVEGGSFSLDHGYTCETCEAQGLVYRYSARTQADAQLFAKADQWWRTVCGPYVFPVHNLVLTAEGTYCRQWHEFPLSKREPDTFENVLVREDETTDLREILRKHVPVDAIEAFTLEDFQAQQSAGQAIYEAAFEAFVGISLEDSFHLEGDFEDETGESVGRADEALIARNKAWWTSPEHAKAVDARTHAQHEVALHQAAEKGLTTIWDLKSPDLWEAFFGVRKSFLLGSSLVDDEDEEDKDID